MPSEIQERGRRRRGLPQWRGQWRRHSVGRWSDSLNKLAIVAGLWAGVVAASHADTLPLLLKLQGGPVHMHYTPGGLDRAANLQDRLELLTADISSWTGETVVLQVYVLSRSDWKEANLEGVFGFPSRIARYDLALPSWGDTHTVEIWRALLGHDLSAVSGMPMRGSPEEAASLSLSDLVAGPEAARVLLTKSGVTGDRDWIVDVMAHTVALSAQIKHEPTRGSEARLLWQELGREVERPGLTSDDGRRFVARWRREAGFFEAARLIQGSSGGGQAKSILKKARKNGNVVTVSRLLESYPQLGEWIAARETSQGGSPR